MKLFWIMLGTVGNIWKGEQNRKWLGMGGKIIRDDKGPLSWPCCPCLSNSNTYHEHKLWWEQCPTPKLCSAQHGQREAEILEEDSQRNIHTKIFVERRSQPSTHLREEHPKPWEELLRWPKVENDFGPFREPEEGQMLLLNLREWDEIS